jgi:hypothetical protein
MTSRTPALFFLIATMACASEETDPCSNTTCQNGGTAVASGSSCSCDCADGFEGQNCETRTIDKLAGNYSSSVDCEVGAIMNSNFTITASTSFVNRINFGLSYFNNSCPIYSSDNHIAYATITGNTLTIPSQQTTIRGNTYTITGSGTVNASTSAISISFMINYSPMDDCYKSCTITLNKL